MSRHVKWLLAAAAAATLAVPLVAHAAEFKTFTDKRTITISERMKNLFVAGNGVRIEAPIAGDLFAAGSNVSVASAVEHDAFVAGQNVTIDSTVGANLFAAGQTLIVRQAVGSDAFLAGSDVTLDNAATVSGDLQIAGMNLSINAPVGGWLRATGQTITLDSTVGGDAIIDGTPVLGDSASINGNLTYYADRDATIDQSKVKGTITRKPVSQSPSANKREHVARPLAIIVGMLATLLFGWALYSFYPKQAESTTDTAEKKIGVSMLTGLVSLIVLPIVAVLLFVSLYGAPFGFLLLVLYVAAMVLAAFLSPWLLGRLLKRWLMKDAEVNRVAIYVAGIIVLWAITWVPVVGWLTRGLIWLWAFGAILYAARPMKSAV